MTRCPYVYAIDTCDREMPCPKHGAKKGPKEPTMSDVKRYTAEEAQQAAIRWESHTPDIIDESDYRELAATLRHYADLLLVLPKLTDELDELDVCSSRADHMQDICECRHVDAVVARLRSAVQRGEG